MALDFPTSPSLNQTYTSGGRTWQWDGTTWVTANPLSVNTTNIVDGAVTVAKLSGAATGNALISGGVGTAPSWGKIGLTTHVSGTLPLANGGTNAALTAVNGGAVYSTGSALAVTAAGTAGQVLTSNGAAAPMWADAAAISRGTAVASTSGTAIDFTGIPSTAKRVTIMFRDVSTSGTAIPMVQLGSTTFTTTGYGGSAAGLTGGGAASGNSAGFLLTSGTALLAATSVRSGFLMLINITGNYWVAMGMLGYTDVNGVGFAAGSVLLSGVLDRVRITTNGTDTFDGGSINITWE